jgi:hypothetical protein
MLKLKYFVRPALRPIVQRARRFIWLIVGKEISATTTDPRCKREKIEQYGQLYNCETFLETGTYRGDTADEMRKQFNTVLSIEIHEPLFRDAEARFKDANNVKLYLGDSSKLMPEMLKEIKGRAIFWLDGHYSGLGTGKGKSECPVLDELTAIKNFTSSKHIILIDDARLFGVDPYYPTMNEISNLLLSINPEYNIFVERDVIHSLPPT